MMNQSTPSPEETHVEPPPIFDRALTGISGVIETDIVCRRCGYALRGLSQAASCPECGRAVQCSLPNGPVDPADRRWFARVARGCEIFLLGIGICIITPLIATSLQVVFAESPWSIGFTILGALIAYVGYWMLLSAPDDGDPQHLGKWRFIARLAPWMPVAAGVLLLAPANYLMSRIMTTALVSMAAFALIAVLISFVALILGSLSLILPARELGLRLNRPDLARASQIGCILFAAANGLSLLLFVMFVAMGAMGSNFSALGVPLVGLACGAQLFLVIGIGWLITVMLMFWYALRQALVRLRATSSPVT